MGRVQKNKNVDHQFSLFGWVKPVAKVPLSKERIAEVKALIEKGDGKTAAQKLRAIREGLESIEKRIHNGKII